MMFKLTEEQLMIQTMVRDFAREVVLPTAMERDRSKEFPAENLSASSSSATSGKLPKSPGMR